MKRIISLLLIFCLVMSLSITAAADTKQHDYSTVSNSGIRHEVCTSLLGTSADSYYTGSNTYEKLSQLDKTTLLTTLRSLMTTTHKKISSYDDCHYKANLTDCENGDGKSISLLYTSFSASQSDWCNTRASGWNREHVWPKGKSTGDFGTSRAGSDLHHVRPSDQPINSARGSKKYGYVSSGSTAKGASYTGSAIGGTYNGTYFEPLDNVKGDVARICLYVYVRWGGEFPKCNDITNVFQSVDVLLEWCALDPVDTWEMGRNEVVGAIQGNRNVFIDYPELAWKLFGKDVPAGMTTPSGNATTPSVCQHSSTTVINSKKATCTMEGYTGDTRCVLCNEQISGGSVIPAKGHQNQDGDNICDDCGAATACSHGKTELRDAQDATCIATGYSGDSYCVYCGKLVSSGSITSTNDDHSFEAWTAIDDILYRQCTRCNYKESVCADGGENCAHSGTTVQNAADPTCERTGYTGDTYCVQCGIKTASGTAIPATGHTDEGNDLVCDICGDKLPCPHANTQWIGGKEATCGASGSTGNLCCTDCGKALESGETIPATGNHSFSDWADNEDLRSRYCTVCGYQETEVTVTEPSPSAPADPAQSSSAELWIAVVAVVAMSAGIVILIKKKKK